MCKVVLLHSTESLQVSYCNHCRHYQVAYLSAIIKFSEGRFQHFAASLADIIKFHKGSMPPQKKCFAIPTGSDDVYLHYCLDEVEYLSEGISVAMLIKQAYSCIEVLPEEFSRDVEGDSSSESCFKSEG